MSAIDLTGLYRKLDEVHSTTPSDTGTIKGVIEFYVEVVHGNAVDDYDWKLVNSDRHHLNQVVVESAAAVGMTVTAEQANAYIDRTASSYAKSEHADKYEEWAIEGARQEADQRRRGHGSY